MTELKQNSRGYTRLLVKIHIDARERLARASAVSGASQQSLIRNGIEMILSSILEHPAATEAAGKRARAARPGRNGPARKAKGGAARQQEGGAR
jgi:hypothetical protein